MASSLDHGSLPSSLSRLDFSTPPGEGTLCLPEWYEVQWKGFIGFPRNPRNTGFSLPLFSTLSFPQDWPTPGQRPFAIWPPSIHHEFSPDTVAQVTLDGTLGCHRLLSFPGSWGTVQPKGPLGRYVRDTPTSVSLSLSLPGQKIRWRPFSQPDSCWPFAMGVKAICPTGLSLGLCKTKPQTSALDWSQDS